MFVVVVVVGVCMALFVLYESGEKEKERRNRKLHHHDDARALLFLLFYYKYMKKNNNECASGMSWSRFETEEVMMKRSARKREGICVSFILF